MPDLPSRKSRGVGGGVVSELKALARGMIRHFIARLFLVSLEGREACVHCFRLIATLVIAVLLFLVSYLLLLSFLVLSLARMAGEIWEWVLLVLAAFHVVGALACMGIFVRYMYKPVFTATLAEVKEDLRTLKLFAE